LVAAERDKMKIHAKDFRVGEGDEVGLGKWPTKVPQSLHELPLAHQLSPKVLA
jgi:hypothetical protein